MTKKKQDPIYEHLKSLSELVIKDQIVQERHYRFFSEDLGRSLQIVSIIVALEDSEEEQAQAYYSACLFALEVCVAHIQANIEAGNRTAERLMSELMNQLAIGMLEGNKALGFWLPILNVFYEVHVELSDALRDAYFELADHEDYAASNTPEESAESLDELLEELAGLSDFEVAEHFFAQSYAMPAEFFPDLMMDLYESQRGQDVALLLFLHPKSEVREVLRTCFDELVEDLRLSSKSLSRLQAMKKWFPESWYPFFERWMRVQRKKGLVFLPEPKMAKCQLNATEIDGTGAQGLFVQLCKGKTQRLSGLLLKQNYGIKDVWITSDIPPDEIEEYYRRAFDDSVELRQVNVEYLQTLINHFLALGKNNGHIPGITLLELQENLGLHFQPELLEVATVLEDLVLNIHPFTEERMREAFKRSQAWTKSNSYTESWYIESEQVDKIVNKNCQIEQGVKLCDFELAVKDLFAEVIELQRADWLFHFLWVSLWLKSKSRKGSKNWEDAALIAYAIHQGTPMDSIPVMQEIAYQTAVNSVETMQERRTYLGSVADR